MTPPPRPDDPNADLVYGAYPRVGITVMAIRDQVAPPTLNLDDADTAAEGVDIVAREARRMPIEHAVSNGFGFGGVNASIIFRRWQ